jgi:hypothetical protein
MMTWASCVQKADMQSADAWQGSRRSTNSSALDHRYIELNSSRLWGQLHNPSCFQHASIVVRPSPSAVGRLLLIKAAQHQTA